MRLLLKLSDGSDFEEAKRQIQAGDDVRLLYVGSEPLKVRKYFSEILPAEKIVAVKDVGVKGLEEYAASLMNPVSGECASSADIKNIAVVSPLPPINSGIAGYTAELAEGLVKFYDVDLITVQEAAEVTSVPAGCSVRSVSYFRKNYGRYDRVLYQMGNSGHHAHMLKLMRTCPGAVVLHDFYLGHLMAWMQYMESASDYLTEAVLFSHGIGGLRYLAEKGHEKTMWHLPANREIFSGSVGVLVHSEYARRLAERYYGGEYSDRLRVVPQVHREAEKTCRESARRSLGLNSSERIVCSFGHIGSVKDSVRLAEVFRRISGMRLIFVGGHTEPAYEKLMNETIEGTDIVVTGNVSDETYADYLQAADMAVQLRTANRGETSRAVLDCMANGLPVIINADGAMSEIPSGCALVLNENFTDEMLAAAITELMDDRDKMEELSANGRAYIKKCSPMAAGRRVYDELESLCSEDCEVHFDRFLQNGADDIRKLDDKGLERLTRAVLHCRSVLRRKYIYVDISVVYRTDHRTGIQRVVRSVLRGLATGRVDGHFIMPVYIADAGGRKCYRKAPEYAAQLISEFGGKPHMDELLDIEDSGDVIEPCQGDIFLGVDFDAVKVYEAHREGLFAEWRERGAGVHFIVYDLLPLKFPQYFPHYAESVHADWLYAVGMSAHSLICISAAVAEELKEWLSRNIPECRVRVEWFHLGADIDASMPHRGLPEGAEKFIAECADTVTFLMVGTVEPRKGHYQAVKAFEVLLDGGTDARLVIAGRFGWLADETVRAIENSRYFNKKIFWLKNAADDYLERLYSASACLLAASYGEGFGLPLIEAAQKGLAVIARDIPVFREVAGENAFFFSEATANGLAQRLEQWLKLYEADKHPKSGSMGYLTWDESTAKLKELIVKY